jgi:hypothetical protein
LLQDIFKEQGADECCSREIFMVLKKQTRAWRQRSKILAVFINHIPQQ